ncbi:MAG: trypsin-like peptidase domain-containing protein [Spartobacteria bacterium]
MSVEHKRSVSAGAGILALALCALAPAVFAQAPSPPPDPAAEPAVLAVAKVLPAVVNINTERIVRRQVRDPFDDFAAQFFGVYRNRPREVRQTQQSLGSGFLVDPAGYIVTNEHVVERAADLKIEVITNDNKSYKARYITGDPKKDLALIKIESNQPLPFVDLHDISPNLLGQSVIVVGNALGYGSSISRGVLSGMKREITIDNVDYHDLIQTDAAINPGNSGGPLIDLSGRLVGISSAKMAFTPQGIPTQGLGFAIPADIVRQNVEQFKKIASQQPPPKPGVAEEETGSTNADRLFGLQLQDLSDDLATALNLASGKGVLVSAVEADSPGDRVGIQRGLVIYRVGKFEVNSVKDVERLLAQAGSGSRVDLAVGIVGRGGRGRRVETVNLVAR